MRAFRILFLTAAAAALHGAMPVWCSGQIPATIGYQGFLADSAASPANGTFTMSFALYTTPTGGSEIWSESQEVEVSDGVYHVKLGLISSLETCAFDTQYYLGISIDPDEEMSPRQALTAAPYAFRAAVAEDVKPEAPPLPPVGSIIAWAKSLAGVPALPEDWVECNGGTVSDPESPLYGQSIPVLNAGNRFLRGSETSGGTGGVEEIGYTSWGVSQSPSERIVVETIDGAPDGTFDNRPPFYNVVWIMRVK